MRPHVKRRKKLTNTNSQSLPQKLARIFQTLAGKQLGPVLRAALAFIAIRNEETHLGPLQFGQPRVIELIGTLAAASLMIWKARQDFVVFDHCIKSELGEVIIWLYISRFGRDMVTESCLECPQSCRIPMSSNAGRPRCCRLRFTAASSRIIWPASPSTVST